jgi:hypothetical protein
MAEKKPAVVLEALEREAGGKDGKEALLRLARMFAPHRGDGLMRELCRLAVSCAQEGLIRD